MLCETLCSLWHSNFMQRGISLLHNFPRGIIFCGYYSNIRVNSSLFSKGLRKIGTQNSKVVPFQREWVFYLGNVSLFNASRNKNTLLPFTTMVSQDIRIVYSYTQTSFVITINSSISDTMLKFLVPFIINFLNKSTLICAALYSNMKEFQIFFFLLIAVYT